MSNTSLKEILTWEIYTAWFFLGISIAGSLFYLYLSPKLIRIAWGQEAGIFWKKNQKERTIENSMVISLGVSAFGFLIGIIFLIWFFLIFEVPTKTINNSSIGEISTFGLLKFLNISTVGAFFGAFFAFMLVILNDWRRNRNKKKLISKQIRINADLASTKMDSIKNMYRGIKEENKLYKSPILRFQTDHIRKLESETLKLLGSEEKLALDSLLFRLDAIDEIILETRKKIETTELLKHKEGELSENRQNLVSSILTDYEDIIYNIFILEDISKLFVQNKFEDIINIKISRENYRQRVQQYLSA